MKSEEKKRQPKQQRHESFAQDGLDTSKAKKFLEEISKLKTNETKADKK